MNPTHVYASLWLLILVPLFVMVINLIADAAPDDVPTAYRYGFSLVAGAFAVLLVLGCL